MCLFSAPGWWRMNKYINQIRLVDTKTKTIQLQEFFSFTYFKIHIKNDPELKTLEWDILNPDRLVNLEINNKRKEIKKKRSSNDFDIHHSKVFSSGWLVSVYSGIYSLILRCFQYFLFYLKQIFAQIRFNLLADCANLRLV